jgi:hypothetical protein
VGSIHCPASEVRGSWGIVLFALESVSRIIAGCTEADQNVECGAALAMPLEWQERGTDEQSAD